MYWYQKQEQVTCRYCKPTQKITVLGASEFFPHRMGGKTVWAVRLYCCGAVARVPAAVLAYFDVRHSAEQELADTERYVARVTGVDLERFRNEMKRNSNGNV